MNYRQKQYYEDPESWREARSAKEEEIRDWLQQIKKHISCQVCGESRVACLDFHHKDPNTKTFNIATAATDRRSKQVIIEELKKCVVLCANCHRVKHSKDHL